MPDESSLGYADAAQNYWDKGWRGVLPLQRGTKWPPPTGFTGYDGRDPSFPDILQWSELYPLGNVCLRLPEGVIGIDVDAYGAKTGGAAFAEAVRRWGPLPEGPQSSSRDDDLVSGLRLFRVPPGTLLETVIVFPELSIGDIEIIQRHHRYAVCWPSVHPEGRGYWWRNSQGQLLGIPELDEIPELPQTWIEGLKLTPRSLELSGDGFDVRQALTGGEPSLVVGARLQMALKELNLPGTSRHDTCLRHVMALLRHGAEGQSGVEQALTLLREVFVAVVTMDGSRVRDVAVTEFNRMITNNNVARELSQPGINDWFKRSLAAQAADNPGVANRNTPPTDSDPDAQNANVYRAETAGATASVGIGGEPSGPPDDSPISELEALEQDFWTARESHQLIFTAALSRMVSPWAVFGSCVARTLALVPPSIVLPDITGDVGSLNWFAAVVGASGTGKGAATRVARRLIPDEGVNERAIGSGEGMVECYNRQPPKGDDPPPPVISVLFDISEISTLGAMSARSGQTTLDILKQGFSGERLGFSYKGRNDFVAENTYRMTVIAGVQPLAAGVLLDDLTGTAQRFMWFSATDARIQRDRPGWPMDNLGGRLTLSSNFPRSWEMANAIGQISIPPEAEDAVLDAAVARSRKEGDALDGHAVFAREKLAFALAFMDGRLEMNSEDWRLSGVAADVSDYMRETTAGELQEVRVSESRERGHLRGVEAAAAEVGKASEQMDAGPRVTANVMDKIKRAMPDGISKRDITRKINGPDQGLVGNVLDYLAGQGLIMQLEGTNRWVTQ